jgi:hypothetical protein
MMGTAQLPEPVPELEHAYRSQHVNYEPGPDSKLCSYRSRVPNLSPTYRSHNVKHEPELHTAAGDVTARWYSHVRL